MIAFDNFFRIRAVWTAWQNWGSDGGSFGGIGAKARTGAEKADFLTDVSVC
jgi:hypothetical protein